jgi:gamma-glutamyl-gamma-aminobutyrate hydrolase PuuD
MNIGISQRIIFQNRNYDCLEHSWYNFLRSHSIYPIPNRLDLDFKKIANDIDLFIISGGNETDVRRIVEIKLATQMLLLKKPVLGICRGAFLLTILLGGEIEECDGHLNTDHVVHLEQTEHVVNSFHSYRIKQIPKSAISIATDSESYCESWIDGNIAAVVWHPERMKDHLIPKIIRERINLHN